MDLLEKTKTNEITNFLDKLLFQYKLITGYNTYSELPKQGNIILCLSNIYHGKNYQHDMFKGLKSINYYLDSLESCIREKRGIYLWGPTWSLVDEENQLKLDLKIRKADSKEYINLEYIHSLGFNSLEECSFYNKKDLFIAEDISYEINLPVNNMSKLEELITLFTKNYSTKIFDLNGMELRKKTNKEPQWGEAWDLPVLYIEGDLNCINFNSNSIINNLNQATKVVNKVNNSEISFIIGDKYETLINSQISTVLNNFGFDSEDCLVNKPFYNALNE
jgi:hypothetical protein